LIRIALLSALLLFGIGERELWRQRANVRGIAGDSLLYFKLAHGLSRTGTLAYDDQTPQWTRLPGYPVLLWMLQVPPDGDRRAFGNFVRRAQWLNLACDLALAALVALLAWQLGARRWAWAGALVWVLQPWAAVPGVFLLSDVAAALLSVACVASLLWAMNGRVRRFVAPGALAAAAQYLRGDAGLLLPVIVFGALAVRSWKGALVALTSYLVVFAPWPIRNLVQFGHPHFLGGYEDLDVKGDPFDRSAVSAWMRTWAAASERSTVDVGWKFPRHAIRVEDLPPEAIDSPEEAAELAAIFQRYQRLGNNFDGALHARLARLAAERTRRHPIATWVTLPLRRMARMLAPPRDGFGLIALPPWERTLYLLGDGVIVAAGLACLFVYLFFWRRRREAQVLGVFLLLRLLLLGWIPTSEPRYFLPALPLLYALAAALPATLRQR
jgi:hypothetical protein